MILTEDKTKTYEDYFIQFLFCKNRELLRKENRELYDALFNRYLMEWLAIPDSLGSKLEIVNENFVCNLFEKKKKKGGEE